MMVRALLCYIAPMPPMGPRIDFKDDGGTRSWRANRATFGRVIDVEPSGFWAAYCARWRKAPVHICLIAIFLGGFVLPWTILIGGIVLLAVWDRIVG